MSTKLGECQGPHSLAREYLKIDSGFVSRAMLKAIMPHFTGGVFMVTTKSHTDSGTQSPGRGMEKCTNVQTESLAN